jgi:hypothetical protein
MRTCDMDQMLHLLCINQSSLSHATTTKLLYHMKLELLCYKLNEQAVLRNGIDLDSDVIPRALEAELFTWYIMPEGGAYVYDAWQTARTFNPNIILLVQRQPGYGVDEGGSGRPTVLDHPLHIALFEDNVRRYSPPHLRFKNVGNRVQPPQSFTPQYPHKLDTALKHSHGIIDNFTFRAYRGGMRAHLLRRFEVERTPSPPPSPYYYSEDENTPSDPLPSSSYLDSYGNRIEKSSEPEPQQSRSYNEPE